uniref:Uncharacterized protein n=1 Tax=Rhizophora mucronata TaxID=61149 RepID=A0A2P2N858_RHIMU
MHCRSHDSFLHPNCFCIRLGVRMLKFSL